MTLGSNIRWTTVKAGDPSSVSARGLNDVAEAVRRGGLAMPGGPGIMGPFGNVAGGRAPRLVAWLKGVDDLPNDDGLWRFRINDRLAGGTDRVWRDPDPADVVWGEVLSNEFAFPFEGRRVLGVLAGTQSSTPPGGGSPIVLPLYTLVLHQPWMMGGLMGESEVLDDNRWNYAVTLDDGTELELVVNGMEDPNTPCDNSEVQGNGAVCGEAVPSGAGDMTVHLRPVMGGTWGIFRVRLVTGDDGPGWEWKFSSPNGLSVVCNS